MLPDIPVKNNVSTFSDEKIKSLNSEDMERIKKIMFPPCDPSPEWMTKEFVAAMFGGIRLILSPSLPPGNMIVSRDIFEMLTRDCKEVTYEKPEKS